MPLVLTRDDVAALLTMEDAIEAVETAFADLHAGRADMPQRAAIRVPDHHGTALFMPAHIAGMGALGIKVVTVYPDNPAHHDLPTVLGLILLNDPATGAAMALMDGGLITAMRTGAVSGVATKHMARADAKSVGIFGAGVQARTQLEAVAAVRALEQAVVYDVIAEQRERFAADMGARLSIPVHAVAEPREAVEGMDVICTATSAREPIFDGDWLSPGTHINGIGSHAPDMRELDTRTIARSRLVVDAREAALAEAGDLLIPIADGSITADHIVADLGDVVAGQVPGRTGADEITLFKSEGLAIQDVSVAYRVLQRARERGVGTEIAV